MPIVLLTPHDTELGAPDELTALHINYLWREHLQHALEAYFVPRIGFNFEDSDVLTTYNNFLNLINDLNNAEVPMSVPLGAIIAFIGVNIPENFLECNGVELLRLDYLELWEVLPPELKIDADTFFLPETRGRMLRGQDIGQDIAEQTGADTVNLTVPNLPAHSHNVTVPSTSAVGSNLGRVAEGSGATAHTINAFSEASVGDGEGFSVLNLNIAVKWIMRVL